MTKEANWSWSCSLSSVDSGEKTRQRDEIDRLTQEFLKNGGEIYESEILRRDAYNPSNMMKKKT